MVVEFQAVAVDEAHVVLADGGQPVALVLFGITLGADAEEAEVEEPDGAGQHPFPVRGGFGGLSGAAVRSQLRQAPGELQHVDGQGCDPVHGLRAEQPEAEQSARRNRGMLRLPFPPGDGGKPPLTRTGKKSRQIGLRLWAQG